MPGRKRWKPPEGGVCRVRVKEIAAAKKIKASDFSRVLRLVLLAPDIVEAILDGRQPAEVQSNRLLKPISPNWKEQRCVLGQPRL
jgi:hypothetical protein